VKRGVSVQRFGLENFNKFSDLIYKQFGIYYSDAKREILQTKLNKLMSKYNIVSYEECYLSLIRMANKALLNDFSNEITVNYTSFFRESLHFDFIKENAVRLFENRQDQRSDGEFRIWSSACSTGEEPYTLAMVLKEALPAGVKIRILATDINKKVLSIAQGGLYPCNIENEVDRYYLGKYFYKTPTGYMISEDIKNIVSFRHFNLLDDFPFKNTFDMVFCRNVMIYFDAAVRQELANKIFNILHSGGLLFTGHSESLSGHVHKFRYVQPAVYEKN
jgi:chemotaxis protein methyltransferase CheR